MRTANLLKLIAIIALMLATSACNLPRPAAPTPFTFPTPDLTLTAIFSQLSPSATPTQPLVQTATQPGNAAPTNTQPPAATTAPLPTATKPAPTATRPAPTATIEPPTSRPDGKLKAYYLDKSPKIDGNLSDWTLDSISIDNVVFGEDSWSGNKDLSADVMIGWDEDYLFIGGFVRDDRYVQNATGANIYKGDSLEILIDTNLQGDYYYNKLSPDDFQLGISPGNPIPGDSPMAYLWFPENLAGKQRDVDIASITTGDGYTFEAAIPWSDFEMNPKANVHYGFAISVSDDDKAGSTVQQSMISTAPDRNLADPTTWGDLRLVK